MAVTKEKSAPYAPASAILGIIDRYRHRGLPTPVDTDVLGRSGISDSLIPRTLYALQALDLITEDGKPTDIFEGIRLAPENDYKRRLEEWLNAAYADVIAFVDPSNDDETKVRDAFRSYKPIGQQPRMVSLFLGLYAAAGVASERSTKPRQPRAPRPQTRTPQKVAPKVADAVRQHKKHTEQPGIPAPISGLLTSLPEQGEGWTKEQRNKFLHTFGAVLDFCFPIVEDKPRGATKEEIVEELV